MKIVVLLKQVPDTHDIRWTKENNIVREGLLSILNPLDEFALECAKGLEEHVSAISMGPMQAKGILEYVLARCANEAILLNDKKFVGSDTLATAKVLKAALKTQVPDFDLILCGQSAADGETAQTPPSLAQLLGVEYVSNVVRVLKMQENSVLVEQKTPSAILELEVALPAVVSVIESEIGLTKPKIQDYINAQMKEVIVLNADDILISSDECGVCGSPTCVLKVYRPQITRKCEIIEDDAIKFILNEVKNV